MEASMSNSPIIPQNTSLLLPPYEQLVPPSEVNYCENRGVAAVWFVRDGAEQYEEREWLAERPNGVELVVVLPPAGQIRNALPLLREVDELRPRGILPHGAIRTPEPIRLLLSSSPRDLSSVVVNHLTRQGILRDAGVRSLVGRVFELAPTVPSISQLSRKLYKSRRTLGRIFESAGLPVPSHWLQFARLLHVSVMIQEKRDIPIFRAATHVGYPDGFTMSNQMKRLIGCRPTDVREHLGYEWIIEEWVSRERAEGRLTAGPEFWQVSDDVNLWLKRCPSKRSA